MDENNLQFDKKLKKEYSKPGFEAMDLSITKSTGTPGVTEVSVGGVGTGMTPS